MVEVKFPSLSEPNNGYDENDLWLGMTPEEVEAWIEDVLQEIFLDQWTPSGPAS